MADPGRYFTQSPQCWLSRGTAQTCLHAGKGYIAIHVLHTKIFYHETNIHSISFTIFDVIRKIIYTAPRTRSAIKLALINLKRPFRLTVVLINVCYNFRYPNHVNQHS